MQTGQLVGTPVRGIAYNSGSLSGITGENGEFRYEEGGTVNFSIGDILLGGEVMGRHSMTPDDLVAGGSADNPAVINIVRLLLSLDASPGDAVITIPASVRQEAVATNPALSWVVESLDFSDEWGFNNAASALVAVLTRKYPFTAVLVDAGVAREKLAEAIRAREQGNATADGGD